MFENPIFFDGWDSVLSVVISVPFVYAFVIVAVRVAGKRSLSQMNNFDWVVTVAMGAIVASSVILPVVTVLDAVTALAALLALQWVTTFATSRSRRIEQAIKARPALLVSDGQFLVDTMRAHRLSEADIRSVLREGGFASLSQVRWVILEADARISIVPDAPEVTDLDLMVDLKR